MKFNKNRGIIANYINNNFDYYIIVDINIMKVDDKI